MIAILLAAVGVTLLVLLDERRSRALAAIALTLDPRARSLAYSGAGHWPETMPKSRSAGSTTKQPSAAAPNSGT